MENTFLNTISNEELVSLPAAHFNGRIVVVEDEARAAEACADLATQSVIGFDTETRPTFRPGPLNKVALLQLSTSSNCYLFRLCRMPLDRSIIKILEDPGIRKVGADVANDIKALQRLRHFKPRGFLDLQDVVGHWGITEKSLRKMSGIILGERVSKAQRLSNWEAASLTPAQERYASTDAWICIEIFDRLARTPKPAGQKLNGIVNSR